MDALQISGKWYISARRAAKEHGYHSDYIGQLVRSGKVKGQKVGRSWYVLADSLTDYLGTNASPVAEHTEEAVEEHPKATKAAVKKTAVSEKIKKESTEPDIEEHTEDTSPVPVEVPTKIQMRTSDPKTDFSPAAEERPLMTYIKEDAPIATPSEKVQTVVPAMAESVPVRTAPTRPAKEETVSQVQHQTPLSSFERMPYTYTSRRSMPPAVWLGIIGILALTVTVGISVFFSFTAISA